jgi:hypothetical protein
VILLLVHPSCDSRGENRKGLTVRMPGWEGRSRKGPGKGDRRGLSETNVRISTREEEDVKQYHRRVVLIPAQVSEEARESAENGTPS